MKPKLLIEVQYDHFTGDRFRHAAEFFRWLRDKTPEACSMNQVKTGLARWKRH